MPTKIVDVVVNIVPKPFPVRVFLMGSSIIACIVATVLTFGYLNQKQDQNATATAVANTNLTATAYIATSQARPTATAVPPSPASLLVISNAVHWKPTSGEFIKFTITNNWNQPVKITNSDSMACSWQGVIDPGQSKEIQCGNNVFNALDRGVLIVESTNTPNTSWTIELGKLYPCCGEYP